MYIFPPLNLPSAGKVKGVEQVFVVPFADTLRLTLKLSLWQRLGKQNETDRYVVSQTLIHRL